MFYLVAVVMQSPMLAIVKHIDALGASVEDVSRERMQQEVTNALADGATAAYVIKAYVPVDSTDVVTDFFYGAGIRCHWQMESTMRRCAKDAAIFATINS